MTVIYTLRQLQLDEFQDLVSEMIDNGHINNDILLALQAHGVVTSLVNLKQRLKEWGLQRGKRDTGLIINALTERVKYPFFLFAT